MSINVNRGLDDQFYRYKMPKLLAKVEGKGNGIKTVVVNMVDIAKALNRPPMYPTKYFGCILGAQVNYDNKNDRYIVNGAHDSSKLQDLLDGFIQKYVLCQNCKNPETVLGVQAKKALITTSCKACGYGGTISSQDKLSTYILKYPPPSSGSNGQVKSKGKDKDKDKKDKKKKETRNGENNGSSSPKNDSDDALQEGNHSNEEAADDDDWCEDTNADAVAKRLENMTLGAKGLVQTDDLEKSTEQRLEQFYEFVKKKREAFPDGFDVNIQKEIVAEAERLDIKDRAVIALCEALFDGNILTQIDQHRLLFLRVS